MIVVIGYGFADDHINKILKGARRSDITKRLLVVSPVAGTEAAIVSSAKRSALGGFGRVPG